MLAIFLVGLVSELTSMGFWILIEVMVIDIRDFCYVFLTLMTDLAERVVSALATYYYYCWSWSWL